jgi:hypothetical protein
MPYIKENFLATNLQLLMRTSTQEKAREVFEGQASPKIP